MLRTKLFETLADFCPSPPCSQNIPAMTGSSDEDCDDTFQNMEKKPISHPNSKGLFIY